MREDDDRARRDQAVLKELYRLVREGISEDSLKYCGKLAERAYFLSKRLSLVEWQRPETLMAFLCAVVKKERDTKSGSFSNVLAAAEFIGLRDETVADPAVLSSEQGEASSPLKIRIRRGAPYLFPRRGRPVSTYRNANPRVPDALRSLLNAIDTFLVSAEDMDRLVATLEHPKAAGYLTAQSNDAGHASLINTPGRLIHNPGSRSRRCRSGRLLHDHRVGCE